MSGGGDGEGTFQSKDFALRAQKKILSQFSSRKTVKMFINERVSVILDLLYQLIKFHKQDKKLAEKFVKNIIKVSIKIGLLTHNNQFSNAELDLANSIATKFRSISMTITSFMEMDYSYDRKFLIAAVDQCEELLVSLVKSHLKEKSVNRIRSITNQIKDTSLLDSAFSGRGTRQYELMQKIAEQIKVAIEAGDI